MNLALSASLDPSNDRRGGKHWDEDSTNYFDGDDGDDGDIGKTQFGAILWEEEEANFFDEVFEDDVEYYETPMDAPSMQPLIIPISSHDCSSSSNDFSINDDAKVLEEDSVDIVEVMGIKMKRRKKLNVETEYGNEFGDLSKMVKGWEDFNEESPYFDDDFLLEEEDIQSQWDKNVKSEKSTFTETNGALTVEEEKYVIRDSNGVVLGWNDWNENEASYFDEAYADDELTYGEKLLLQRKVNVTNDNNEFSPFMQTLSREVTIIPTFEGKIVQEWEEWNNDAFIGADADFGDEEEDN